MERRAFFITHPNVVVSREVPVPDWPLSDVGVRRMHSGLAQPWIGQVSAVYCSTERKARDAASLIAQHLKLPISQLKDLGENDRSSTGFLPPPEFERVADRFFADPDNSVRGWETARSAQARIVRAVGRIVESDDTKGCIAIVSHGAVGTLLYCHLARSEIHRRYDQPANAGGNYFSFPLSTSVPDHAWRQFDVPAA